MVGSAWMWQADYALMYAISVIVSSGWHKNIPQTGRLKQQTLIFSQFWRLDGQDEGSSRVGFWGGLSSWLGDSHLLTVPWYGLPSVHMWREGDLCCLFLFLYGHQSYGIRAPHLYDLNYYFIKSPVSEFSYHWGLRLQNMNLGGEIQSRPEQSLRKLFPFPVQVQ